MFSHMGRTYIARCIGPAVAETTINNILVSVKWDVTGYPAPMKSHVVHVIVRARLAPEPY